MWFLCITVYVPACLRGNIVKSDKVSFYNLYQQSYVKREHISIQINIVLNVSFVLVLISIDLMNSLDMLAQCAYKMTFNGDFCRNVSHIYTLIGAAAGLHLPAMNNLVDVLCYRNAQQRGSLFQTSSTQ